MFQTRTLHRITAIVSILTLIILMFTNSNVFTYAVTYQLNYTKISLEPGETAQLKVNSKKPLEVLWKSSNAKIVSVSKTGKLTAKKDGVVTITAKINKKKLSCKITVKTDKTKQEAAKLVKKYKKEINVILKRTNQYRSEAGMSPLKLDSTLSKAASYRSLEMAKNDVFSHVRPDGTSCFTVLDYYSIKRWGAAENIALGWGIPDPETISRKWFESEGHKINMLNGDYTKIGIGIAVFDDKIYYTQLFTGTGK